MNQLIRLSVCGGAFVLSTLLSIGMNTASADAPPPDQYRERVPVQRDQERQPEVRREAARETGWGARLAPGVAVWLFDDEDAQAAPALYADVYNREWPLNFRVGIEGRHVELEQENAAFASDGLGNDPEITYIRIPFAVEYVVPVSDTDSVFLGGGPDFINAANDISDTNVGMHLGARYHHGFNEHWGVAVEAGYMWADFDGPSEDVNLDGAYITPTVVYSF